MIIVLFLAFVFEAFVADVLLKDFIPVGPDALVTFDSTYYLPTYIYVIFMIINAIIVIIMIFKDEKIGRFSRNCLLGGFVFRIFLMIWDINCKSILVLPNAGFDDMKYYYGAMSIVIRGKEATGYDLVLSVIFRLFGISKMFGQYINIVISMLSLIVLVHILNRIKLEKKYKNLGILFACFLPIFAIMNSLLLRESMIIFFLMLTFYFFVRWWNDEGNSLVNMVLAMAGCFAATWLHSGLIAYITGFLMIFVITKTIKRKRYVTFDSRTVMLMFLAIGVVLIYTQTIGSDFLSYLGNIDSVSSISEMTENYVDGNSAYDIAIIPGDGIVALIGNSPLRMVYFLVSPMPWDWRGPSDVLAFAFSGCFYVLSVVYTIRAVKVSEDENHSLLLVLLLLAFCSAFIFSWGVSNAGTALRHRDKFAINYILMFIISKSILDKQKGIPLYERIKQKAMRKERKRKNATNQYNRSGI